MKIILSILCLICLSVAQADESHSVNAIRSELMDLHLQTHARYTKSLNRFFHVHTEDTNRYFPRLADLSARPIPSATAITGQLRYGGLVSKPYRYDVLVENESAVIEVRIHLKDKDLKTRRRFTTLLEKVSKGWTEKFPQGLVSFPVSFRFVVVEVRETAHFSISINPLAMLSLFDTSWHSTNYSTGFHEIGHMLGLNDEYDYTALLVPFMRYANCEKQSVMCRSEGKKTGEIRVTHAYTILRRLWGDVQ